MNKEHIEFGNRDLTVRMQYPDQVYHGSRFEHAAIFDSIQWKGHEFTSIELPEGMPGPDSKGKGMIVEFRGIEDETFQEDVPGSRFAKLGVGTLINNRPGRYVFMHEYPVAELCQSEVFPKEHGVTVITRQPPFEGFSCVSVKNIYAESNSLTVTTTIVNTGTRDLDLMEYNHNFAAIDRLTLDQGRYELTVPGECSFEQVESDLLKAEGKTLRFLGTPEVFYGDLGVSQNHKRWELVSRTAGVGMSETDTGEKGRLYLWGKAHVISPEGYLHIAVPAGSSFTWTRKWAFFDL